MKSLKKMNLTELLGEFLHQHLRIREILKDNSLPGSGWPWSLDSRMAIPASSEKVGAETVRDWSDASGYEYTYERGGHLEYRPLQEVIDGVCEKYAVYSVDDGKPTRWNNRQVKDYKALKVSMKHIRNIIKQIEDKR